MSFDCNTFDTVDKTHLIFIIQGLSQVFIGGGRGKLANYKIDQLELSAKLVNPETFYY